MKRILVLAAATVLAFGAQAAPHAHSAKSGLSQSKARVALAAKSGASKPGAKKTLAHKSGTRKHADGKAARKAGRKLV